MNWKKIIVEDDITEDFLKEHIEHVDWDYLISNKKFQHPFITTFASYLNWERIVFYQTLSEETIERYADRLNWFHVSLYQPLSERFILQHWEKIYFAALRKNENVQLTEEKWNHLRSLNDEYVFTRLLHLNHNENTSLFWKEHVKKVIIPEDILREHAHLFSGFWHHVCEFQALSEEFIREFYHAMEPEYIMYGSLISESFIEEIVKKEKTIDLWDLVSQYQKLSFPFVKKHIKHIFLKKCKKNKHLSFTKEQWEELEQLKK